MSETVTLEKLRVATAFEVGESFMETFEGGGQHTFDVVRRDIIAGLVFQLDAKFLGSKDEEIDCKWPKDWVEAFKERWFPESFKKVYPVKYNQRILKGYSVYPKMPIPKYDSFPHLVKGYGDHHDWECDG